MFISFNEDEVIIFFTEKLNVPVPTRSDKAVTEKISAVFGAVCNILSYFLPFSCRNLNV